MVIIAGSLTVDREHRDALVAAHADLIRRARAAPGCLDVAITADPLDVSRVYNYERWESWKHIHAWRAVADAPEIDTTIHEMDVMAYEIASVGSPFPE